MNEHVTLLAGPEAFGDGSHPTTQGVLAAIDAIDPGAFTPRIACDMGAGSGILALAVAIKFGCHVLAVDLMRESVEAIKANAGKNDLAHRLRAVHSDGFSHPEIEAHAPFDLIVMNILAEPLLALARDAERYLAEGGVLILSGILSWQEQQIREAYEGLRLELTSRLSLKDWVTLVFQKP